MSTTRFHARHPILPLAAAALLAALLGCAAPGADPEAPRDRTTASDQTDADRRARVRLELAAGYFGRGQFETALDEVKLALAAKPDLSEALSLRGLIYAALRDDRLAEDSFRRALQANPRDPDAMHNYGWFLCERRRFGEAIQQFQQAIAQPQYAAVSRSYMTLGICQARSGALAEAEKNLSRSYELDSSNPVTAVNLSDVLYRRGELERARFYIRRVNNITELSSAQTLWLAAKIEHKLGNVPAARDFGRQLRNRFPQSPEALAFERGRYDE